MAESILKNRRGYGISQNPDTKVYILAFDDKFLNGCRNCSREYHPSISIKCCDPCLISDLKDNLTNWTSGDEKIDNFIKEKQLKIEWYNDKIFEWIPYDKFIKINEMSRESRFATALLKNGLLSYNMRERRMMRKSYEKVYLKYLHNPQIITDEFLDEFQLSIKNHNDTIFEWIPYNEFIDIKKTIRGDFITAIWKKGPSCYSEQESKYKRKLNAVVLLKNLYNSQNTDNTILNKIANSIKESYGLYQDPVTKDFILVLQPKYYCKICGVNYDIPILYGMSQNPSTKDYIMVFEHAGENFNNYLNKNCENFNWLNGIKALHGIIEGLNEIHQKHMVHQIFHIGNILFRINSYGYSMLRISDMELCRKIDDIDETNIYGRGSYKPGYTRFFFGCLVPFFFLRVNFEVPFFCRLTPVGLDESRIIGIVTGKQPFADCAHDEVLALDICNGVRPEVNDQVAPKFYIDLMKKCWDSNPENRPLTIDVKKVIELFYNSLDQEFKNKEKQHYEIDEAI
ncbi:kinase-like domain-containing protein [Rhizophagus clarus]|uniref:Kinase-like domain-containing protein n=1 Tax=Rhizophagus clarus TaxID=94130 RepID=A0A8H3QWQ3_9GLOM|nr:kinase-like domain-containing protein [Rhizophagus clarus]